MKELNKIMVKGEYEHYLCLERLEYTDGTFGNVEVCYQSIKPKIGDKNESVFWAKGYDTAVGYEAYKELSKRVGAYKGKISDSFAKDLARDVVKNFDDSKAMWDYATKITKIGRELKKVKETKGDYAVVCSAMKAIEAIVKHQ